MNPLKKPVVAAFTFVLFGFGLASLGVMFALQRALGGAHLKSE